VRSRTGRSPAAPRARTAGPSVSWSPARRELPRASGPLSAPAGADRKRARPPRRNFRGARPVRLAVASGRGTASRRARAPQPSHAGRMSRERTVAARGRPRKRVRRLHTRLRKRGAPLHHDCRRARLHRTPPHARRRSRRGVTSPRLSEVHRVHPGPAHDLLERPSRGRDAVAERAPHAAVEVSTRNSRALSRSRMHDPRGTGLVPVPHAQSTTSAFGGHPKRPLYPWSGNREHDTTSASLRYGSHARARRRRFGGPPRLVVKNPRTAQHVGLPWPAARKCTAGEQDEPYLRCSAPRKARSTAPTSAAEFPLSPSRAEPLRSL